MKKGSPWMFKIELEIERMERSGSFFFSAAEWSLLCDAESVVLLLLWCWIQGWGAGGEGEMG